MTTMKSFKQKQEEKQKRLDAERLIVEENAFKIQQQKESDRIEQTRLDEIAYNKALLQEQQEQENAIWEERESRKIESKHDLDYKESINRNKQIDDYRKLKDLELEYRSAQKGKINEILSGEDNVRDTISSIERQVELDDYESLQLQKIETAEKLLEQQELEYKAEHILERKAELAEESKLARWKENEKIEDDEKQRMKELRESQEKDRHDKEAIQLQEIISSREIYELRQKEIAKEQLQKRIAVNNILQEAQYILDSQKQTHSKDVLSSLHDYIYRLNPDQEKDIWTERVQPKAILTWDDWKHVPSNNILIEQDFKRARLLFEQDNQRAQRYHDHMYQNFAARNLTLDRKKAIAADGKLVDIPQSKLVAAREELVSDIDSLQVWLDAAEPSSMQALVTQSINTASIEVAWISENQINVNTNIVYDSYFYDSASLVISGANALFDGDPNTYMSIKHTSESFDWNTRSLPDVHHNYRGTVMIKFSLPAEYTSSVIERLELTSTDRKFIPTKVDFYVKPNSSVQNNTDMYLRHERYFVTHSVLGNYNSQIGPSSEPDGTGGAHGITAEGSASLDPLMSPLYPRMQPATLNNDYYPGNDSIGYENEYVYYINIAATGSELRFQGFKAWEDIRSQNAPVHKQSINVWKDKRFANDEGMRGDTINAEWHRTKGTLSSRENPPGAPVFHSGSKGQPDGINMPYMQFSSQSFSSLRSSLEFVDSTETDGFTHFFVYRITNIADTSAQRIFSDYGDGYKSQYLVEADNYYQGLNAIITDWTNGGTSQNTRHQISLQSSYQSDATVDDQYGVPFLDRHKLPWPYAKDRWPSEQNEGNEVATSSIAVQNNMSRSETTMLCTQLDNPIGAPDSASKFRLWHKGGTPFVDLDATFGTTYDITRPFGVTMATPVLGGASQNGGEWASMELHEMLYFNSKLSPADIETVSNYLRDKWKLNNYDIKSDEEGDFIYGLSSSDASQDVWSLNTSNYNNNNPFSSSLWILQ